VCELQTGTQDVRLPVQAISPFTAEGEAERLVDLSTAKPGPYLGTFVDPVAQKPMDLIGQYGNEGIAAAKATSDRFAIGANFCNKLWNAARFAFLNVEGAAFTPLEAAKLPLEDRWILSRLQHAITTVDRALLGYNPAAAIAAARDFFWNEFCDWYLELMKPRFKDGAEAAARATGQQVLAAVLDQTLRLMHPFVPFLTETLWTRLCELAPTRGIGAAFATSEMLVAARWPAGDAAWHAPEVEHQIAAMQQWCVAIRETRARYQVPPRERLAARFAADGEAATVLAATRTLLANMAGLAEVTVAADAERTADAATVVLGAAKAYLLGVVDLDKEKAKLQQQAEKLKGQIGGLEKKLGNEGFVSKAPPAVVEQQRDNLEKLRQQLAGIEQSLAEL
ncbi:MAG: class I tRNA ligase family protein, partial [Planctomycetes bacterium]|nr:class I tRNA ligase family protein [Planctomycetota bacterium]